MKRVLLTHNGLSTSYIRGALRNYLKKPLKNTRVMLIIPFEDYHTYASYYYAHESDITTAGIRRENIITKVIPQDVPTYEELISCDVVYVLGVSTERLLTVLGKYNLITMLHKAVCEDEVMYIGANAGTIIASRSVNAGLDFVPYRVYTVSDTDNEPTRQITDSTAVINLGDYNFLIYNESGLFII